MNTLQTPIQVMNKMVALNLSISLWTARKKITSEDVEHIPNTDLPPQELATLGSKRIAPPENLRIFSTLKVRAFSLLDRFGIRFMSGWAIPEDSVNEVVDELTKILDEFNTEKEKFLNEYDTLVADWINKHPQWQEMLAKSVDTSDYVRSRFAFTWQLFRIQSENKKRKPLDLGLVNAVENMGNTVFDDIAKIADETWRKVYEGKNSVTHKALSPLRTLHKKLNGLSFIEPHILPVAQMIEEALNRTAKKGNIIGNELLTLQGLVLLMRDKDALLSHATKLIDMQVNGQDVHTALDALLGNNLDMAAYIDVYAPSTSSEAQSGNEEELIEQMEALPIITDSMGLW